MGWEWAELSFIEVMCSWWEICFVVFLVMCTDFMDVFLHSSPFQILDPSMAWYETHNHTARVILNSHFISTSVCV